MTKAGRRRRRNARLREIRIAQVVTGILIVVGFLAAFSIEKAGSQAIIISIVSMALAYLIHTFYVPKYL